MENRVFISETTDEDLNRIDVLTSESVSNPSEQGSSLGSRNLLTCRDTNYRYPSESPHSPEFIELATSGNLTRRKSSFLNGTILNDTRVPTPTNMVRRWSQSISRFSKNKRSIREKTIYRLPSRHVFEINGKPIADDPVAELEQLVKEIEQHDYLMKDTALSKQSRLETLRALPHPLSKKRLLKAKLSLTIEANEQSKGTKKIINFVITIFIKFWLMLCKIYNSLEIWYDALKTIEGHFGSNVTSYFKFLRCLLAFNLILLIFPLCFITLPQILYNTESVSENVSALMELQDSASDETNKTIEIWSFMDFLTGEGYLKSSLLFYGSYSNGTFRYRNLKTTYSIPHAYYMTMLLLYLSTFVIISTSMARCYRISFIATGGSGRGSYAQKIFCAWDYSISHRKAADLKHLAIYTELREVLNELGELKPKLSIWTRIWIFLSHFMTHVLVFILITALGVAIWTFLKEFAESISDSSSWGKLNLASIVNVSIVVFQTLFSWITRMEDYRTPQRTLHITLVRNFLLEFVMIALLVYYWLTKKNDEGWETAIGQETYRLIISDFFISLLILPILNCLRVFVLLRFWPHCERPEFDISQKSLALVFNQTMLWIGLFFAPLLALIMAAKMILQFYVNKAMLTYLCKSPRHVWRSAQTHTFYLVFIFLSLLGVIIALGYIMTQIPLSQESGPFRDNDFMFQIFIDGVLKLRSNPKVWSTLMFLIRPAVVGGVLIIMSVMVYYLRTKSQAHCMMVKLLKEMLYLEAKDKEFLLMSITNITKGRKWSLNNLQADIAAQTLDQLPADTSTTWRYKRNRGNGSQHGSNASMESVSSAISSIDECILRNRKN